MMTVRLGGKITGTAMLCCVQVVYNDMHTRDQFLSLYVVKARSDLHCAESAAKL